MMCMFCYTMELIFLFDGFQYFINEFVQLNIFIFEVLCFELQLFCVNKSKWWNEQFEKIKKTLCLQQSGDANRIIYIICMGYIRFVSGIYLQKSVLELNIKKWIFLKRYWFRSFTRLWCHMWCSCRWWTRRWNTNRFLI